MDEVRFPEIIRRLYEVVDELEGMFPGRHFTPDGHMVGSLGEALAAYYYGLELLTASTPGRDATCGERAVEVKATQGTRIGLRCAPQHLLVLKIGREGKFTEIFNGNGDRAWTVVKSKPIPKNGQHPISLTTLKKLMPAFLNQND
ncbi:MAG: hypothetical protein HYZ75_16075 [Elusimicrobia bacterium]|nr:hypothetical protein [Elusimicrobiota bacterium]